jgi:hypothetical protein
MKLKFPLFFLFVFITYCNAYSQSLYKFKYEFQEEHGMQGYEAFLTRFDDGTGFIRVKFFDNVDKKSYLVNMEMEESYDADEKKGTIDSSRLYFTGFNPTIITGDPSMKYSPDIFVFKKSETDGYYEPLEVISPDDDSSEDVGNFLEAKLLEENDLTEEFVLQFFTKNDEFYKNLFRATVRTLPADRPPVQLHLLIVANTEDENIGSTCVKDKDRTLKTFTDLADFLKFKLDVKTVFGKDYNKKNVEAAIQSIQAGPNDVVVFYYTGHGFSNPNDNYQYPHVELRAKSYEKLEGNSLSMEEIYNTIKRKGANLNIVMSDCCNSDPNASNIVSGDMAPTRSSSIGWSYDNCLKLFMPTKPVSILVTAASKGEMSAGNINFGGFFTYNFRSSLESSFGPFYLLPTWQNILEEAKKETIKKAEHTLCVSPSGPTAKCKQTPVFKIEGGF